MQQNKWTLLILFAVVTSMAGEITATEPKVPQTFGLMTMTYARGGDNSVFDSFLKHYSEMDCPIITEMNIVWNNQQTPEQMGVFKNSQNWKRPINFYLTPHNALNWRYTIPKGSQARVYFSMDDDIIVDCKELTRGFKTWQANAIGQIGPIVSYWTRVFYYSRAKQFEYGQYALKQFYTIGLIGISFVSRHYLQLYYSDLWILEEMRKVVIEKNNCEDIAMNWIAQYFYPELVTIAAHGNIGSAKPSVAVSTSPGHYKKRNDCIRQFTNIFGVNALRYKPLSQKYPATQKRSFPFRNETVLARKAYLEREVLHKNNEKYEVNDNLQKALQSNANTTVKLTQDNSQIISHLEAQLADARLQQARLMINNDQLKKQVQKAYTLLNQSKIGQGQSLKLAAEFNSVAIEPVASQQPKQILIYTGVGLIGLVILICLWKLTAKWCQHSSVPHKTDHNSRSNPQQGMDFVTIVNPQSNRSNMQ